MSEKMTQLLEKLAAVTVERDRLAAELAKLRAQEPVAYLDYWKSDGTGIVRKQRTTGVPFFNHPVPAPADSAPTNAAIRESHALKNRIESLAKGGCVAGLWVNFESGLLLCNYILQSTPQAPAVPTGASIATPEAITRSENWPALPTPTPFIPDDDTRRNDEAFAAQQAAPSVPEEWRAVMAELAADLQAACDAEHPHRDQYPSIMRKYQNDMRIVERARALLLSADHSEQTLEKVAPDCRACANRGRVNGLSQESFCDSCIYQGRDWRKNHFVDAAADRLLEGGE